MDQSGKKKKTTPSLQVSCLEQFERDGRTGIRIAWRIKGKTATFLVRSERVQELIPTPDHSAIEYVCWETYYGLLANSMKNHYGKQLLAGYAGWMDGLKKGAEMKAEEEERTKDKTYNVPVTL